jgi:SAM-dependent methyltransferase
VKSLRQHWDAIFESTPDSELGWFEDNPAETLQFLGDLPVTSESTVFLPGAGTSALVDALLEFNCRLVLNDISAQALEKLESRIGARTESVTWLHHDISQPLPPGLPAADLWIDRAVLHFLTEESAIRGYFANLKRTVRPGGHVLLAEFSSRGATKCAGLDVHRYSLEEMTTRLGGAFQLLRHEYPTATTPSGSPRPYVFALFRRSQ